jgi:hypothetical protein
MMNNPINNHDPYGLKIKLPKVPYARCLIALSKARAKIKAGQRWCEKAAELESAAYSCAQDALKERGVEPPILGTPSALLDACYPKYCKKEIDAARAARSRCAKGLLEALKQYAKAAKSCLTGA